VPITEVAVTLSDSDEAAFRWDKQHGTLQDLVRFRKGKNGTQALLDAGREGSGLSHSGIVQHRLVEVGYDVASVWRKSWHQCSRDHAAASSGF
jgi:hypothetical protein